MMLVNARLVDWTVAVWVQSAIHTACKWLQILSAVSKQSVIPYPLKRKAAAVQLPGALRRLILLAASLDAPDICAATMTSLQKQ